jgi:hypothetical protein
VSSAAHYAQVFAIVESRIIAGKSCPIVSKVSRARDVFKIEF